MDQHILSLNGISKEYSVESRKIKALDNINLNIQKCSQIAITGKSGAGKSTLLHILGTLDKASSGSYTLEGLNLVELSDKKLSKLRNRYIGFVFQMNNLLPEFNALENVLMPCYISGTITNQHLDRAHDLLKRVQLSERTRHRPAELSGGEQQRVAIARSLIMSPKLLLADEPTGNLDNKTSHEVSDLFFSLCEEEKITMLLVTHDLDLSKKMLGQINMADGQIIECRGRI